jgi:hypothetical protein
VRWNVFHPFCARIVYISDGETTGNPAASKIGMTFSASLNQIGPTTPTIFSSRTISPASRAASSSSPLVSYSTISAVQPWWVLLYLSTASRAELRMVLPSPLLSPDRMPR